MGDLHEAHATLVRARAIAEETMTRRWLWPILWTMSDLAAARGDQAEAAQLRRESRDIVTSIADRCGTDELRATFLSLPEVCAVRE